jgi:hypothetical protein
MNRTAALVRASIVPLAWIFSAPGCSSDNQAGRAPDASSDSHAPGDDSGTTIPTYDGGRPPKLKDIGSPCTTSAECRSGLMCDTSFPGGLCTKACTMDMECTGKRISGACVGNLCFAACVMGAVSDAGVPKPPCKNKAFDCVPVPGHAGMVCLPPSVDGGGMGDGGSGEAGTDAESDATVADGGMSDGPADASTEDAATDSPHGG